MVPTSEPGVEGSSTPGATSLGEKLWSMPTIEAEAGEPCVCTGQRVAVRVSPRS